MIKTFLQTYKPTLTASVFCLSIIANAQFQQTSKITGDRESRAEFGTSAAINDNFAIVGASRESIAAGAAYIYKKDENGDWGFSQKIVADDALEMAEFGGGVKLSNNFMVIASGRADINGVIRAGGLYVYELVGNTWVFIRKITASDYSDGAMLGMNPTTLDVDSNTIIAGAPGEFNWLGSVYVFERNEDTWSEVQKITPPEAIESGTFGIGVSISGNFLIAGASGEDNGAGSAYIFEKGNDGTWEFLQKITASDPQPNSYFGNSVSIYNDQLVVGAYAEGSVGGNIAAAYIFERNNEGEWIEIQKIPSPVSDENTYFAWMCKMDGNQMIISSPHVYGEEPGEVFLYNKTESGQWEEVQSIEAEDDILQDFYGWSVDLHAGNVIIGSPRDDFDQNGENEMMDAGSAYIFTNPNLGINDQNFLKNSIKLYPNPTEDQLNIISEEKIQSVEVFNTSGQKIVSTKQNVINVSLFPKGTYIVKVSTVSGKINTQKFIKK